MLNFEKNYKKQEVPKLSYSVGTTVSWRWGPGRPRGVIEEIHKQTVEKEIKGTMVKRNGTVENPAYYIKTRNNSHVLKLHSEIKKIEQNKN